MRPYFLQPSGVSAQKVRALPDVWTPSLPLQWLREQPVSRCIIYTSTKRTSCIHPTDAEGCVFGSGRGPSAVQSSKMASVLPTLQLLRVIRMYKNRLLGLVESLYRSKRILLFLKSRTSQRTSYTRLLNSKIFACLCIVHNAFIRTVSTTIRRLILSAYL